MNNEEQPVGGGAREMEEPSPTQQLLPPDAPIAERLTCKDWKIRKDAFDELKKTLQNLLTSESCMDVLAFHANLW